MQGCIGRDHASGSVLSVGVLRGTDQEALLSFAHLGDSLVPTLDDLTGIQDELELFSSVSGGVELLAVGESAMVVDADLAALGRFLTVAFFDDLSLHDIISSELKLSSQFKNSPGQTQIIRVKLNKRSLYL